MPIFEDTLRGHLLIISSGKKAIRKSEQDKQRFYSSINVLINGRVRFGVNYVDFTDPERPRTPKGSAKQLAKIFADNGFRKEDNEFLYGRFPDGFLWGLGNDTIEFWPQQPRVGTFISKFSYVCISNRRRLECQW